MAFQKISALQAWLDNTRITHEHAAGVVLFGVITRQVQKGNLKTHIDLGRLTSLKRFMYVFCAFILQISCIVR